jgi:hypothetical protein
VKILAYFVCNNSTNFIIILNVSSDLKQTKNYEQINDNKLINQKNRSSNANKIEPSFIVAILIIEIDITFIII